MSTAAGFSFPLAQLREGAMQVHTVDHTEIVVCRTKHGIYAVDNVCTHAFARLCEGRLRGTRLICPLHGASFDVRDGRVLGAPATRALGVHAVSVVDGRVEISVKPAESGAAAVQL